MKDILSFLLLVALVAIVYPFAALAVKTGTRNLAWNAAAATAEPVKRLLAFNAALARDAKGYDLPLQSGGEKPGEMFAFNASLFDQSNFSEELTGYAVGYKDPEDIAKTLEFVAPEVPSPRKPEYATFSSPEEFLAAGVEDDLRAIGGDFPTYQYKSDKVVKKLLNRGLAVELDEDQIEAYGSNWQEHFTGKLIRAQDRLELRRSIALLSAAATNTAKTWSTASGKNPDGDVRAELIAAATVSGIRPNRVLYGDTAWDTRAASHEAQTSAGGFAASQRTPETLATFLGVDGVHVSKERYAATKTAATLAEIVSTLVLMFNARSGLDMEDPSNIKRFTGRVSGENGGGKVAVHLRQVGDKRWRLAVERYTLTVITSTLGIRQFTVAAS